MVTTNGSSAGGDSLARLYQLADLATPFAIRTVVTMRVAEQIASGTDRLDDLARACHADPGPFGRLLRYLVRKDVFAEVEPGRFALTEIGELLRDRSAGGHGTLLDLGGLGARMDLAFAGLPHAIQTGEPGYASVYGRDFWADLDAEPAFRATFDNLMLGQQRVTAPEVAALYPWDKVRHVIDVGGGSGGLLAEVLGAHPHLRGTMVDRSGARAAATRKFAEQGLAGRADVVAGNIFESLPAGGDVYVVSRVLTDWNDERATAILRRCAQAAGPAGRVLVVEVLPPEPDAVHWSPYDLTMLVLVGGQERTVDDHIALAAAAGLVPAGAYHGTAGLTLLEFTARS
jgi:precorrin-6B methylase 2